MKLSLRLKMFILLIALSALLSAAGILMSRRTINYVVDTQFESKANDLSATVATVIDKQAVKQLIDEINEVYNNSVTRVTSEEWGSEEFYSFIEQFNYIENEEYFKKLISDLRQIERANDVDCIYLGLVAEKDNSLMYALDADMSDPVPVGVIDDIVNLDDYPDYKNTGFPAYVTNTEEYGWLVTAAAPIKLNEETIAFAYVDITMDAIREMERNFLVTLSLILSGIAIIASLVSIALTDKGLIKPINSLSKAAEEYVASKDEKHSSFKKLTISTGDEIEKLHKSIVKMESDIDDYIDNLINTRAQLSESKKETAKMGVLATKDGLTGVKNKLAYNSEIDELEKKILEGDAKFGIAIVDLNDLKYINDNFGHNRGDISIRIISEITCNVFKHSPVFRIGGDEFTVILMGRDYENIDELIAQFKEKIAQQKSKGNDPWEQITAAIGFAAYDPECDASVTEVFSKADKAMYENKKEMKNNL